MVRQKLFFSLKRFELPPGFQDNIFDDKSQVRNKNLDFLVGIY